jgi:hypothetical protein
MADKSPTQRTLREMERRGYECFIVEHWNNWARRRVDLFGFIDILCLGDNEVIGVQTTSGSNLSARVKKIAEHKNVAAVRKAGIGILVHAWSRKSDGSYRLREVDVS